MYYIKCNPWKRTIHLVLGIIGLIVLNILFIFNSGDSAYGAVVTISSIMLYLMGARDVWFLGNERNLKLSRGGGKKQEVWKMDGLCLSFRIGALVIVFLFWLWTIIFNL